MKYITLICALFFFASCQQAPQDNNPLTYDSDGTGSTELLWDKLEEQLPVTNSIYVAAGNTNLSTRAAKQHQQSAPTLAAYYTDRLKYYLQQRGFEITAKPIGSSLILHPTLTDVETQSGISDVQSFRMMGRISGQPDLGMESGSVMPAYIKIATSTAIIYQDTELATLQSGKQMNRFYLTRDSLDGVMQLLDSAALDASYVLFNTMQQQADIKKLRG